MIGGYFRNISIHSVLIYLLFVSQLFEEHWGSKVLIIGSLVGLLFSIKERKYPDFTFWGYGLYFGFCLLSIFWSIDIEKSLLLIGGLLPFIFIPLWINSIRTPINYANVFQSISLTYVAIGVYNIGSAGLRFSMSQNIEEFFYHPLVSPLQANAIYISLWYLLVFLINIFLLKKENLNLSIVLINFFFVAFIFLLSSKMLTVIMVITGLILLWPSLKNRISHLKYLIIGLTIAILLACSMVLVSGSVIGRFKEISNIEEVKEVFTKKEFGHVYPWNGLTLRLIQLRSFWDIEKSDAFNPWIGVGINNGQKPLNEMYKKYDLYSGENGDTDGGFFNYNFHNQYTQTLIETGIIGFIVLVFIVIQWFSKSLKENRLLIISVGFSFVSLMLTESILLRQKGIVAFVFIPYLILKMVDYKSQMSKDKLIQNGKL